MPRERKNSGGGEGGAPGWVVTYGDMMSLLLTFFILLAAFSTISEEDFKKAMGSLEGAFSVFPKYQGLMDMQMVGKKEKQRMMQQTAQKLAEELQIKGLDKQVQVEYDAKGGIKITLPDVILFDKGEAELKPEAVPVLDVIAKTLGVLRGVFIEVKGHTDNAPIQNTGRFRDNYDLSYARAVQVMRRLQSLGTLSSENFEITACGPNQPVASNLTEEGRAQNRRVEIFIRGFLEEEQLYNLQNRRI
ncbi:MAG: flagellar motor protein MotB [Candidatus Hydrogenedentes bacterium]|nr:flagellar motor protein MotB [Candidatus Hydrogenedentota bacterium]